MKMLVKSWLPWAMLVTGLIMAMTPSAYCQEKAKLSVNAKSGSVELKAMTSQDLKNAISYAAMNGDIATADAKELIDKITDIETLMDQFDFIREHERSMISTMGSLYR